VIFKLLIRLRGKNIQIIVVNIGMNELVEKLGESFLRNGIGFKLIFLHINLFLFVNKTHRSGRW